MIRLAREDDLPALRAIENAAGKAFADIGMAFVADDEPPTIETLRTFQQDGRAWVSVDRLDRPVAYLIAELVDGSAHIEQVSVHPDHRGEKLGARLIDHLEGWARDQGAPAMTLTSFTEVIWNGPYYERFGFRRLGDAELTPGLREIRAAEAAHGLDRRPRAAMRRELSAAPPAFPGLRPVTDSATPPAGNDRRRKDR